MKVSVLGTGGHGWRSLAGLIDAYSSSEFTFWYLTVDWGGCTGLWGRMIEAEQGKFNTRLHGTQIYQFRPFGDICKVIDYYLKRNFDATFIESVFLSRTITSLDADLLVHMVSTFCNRIGIAALFKDLLCYTQKSIDCLKEYCTETQSTHLLSSVYFGYIFVYFLYIKSHGCMLQLNVLLHTYGIIPRNLNLLFTHSTRKVLSYSDSQFSIQGEDKIDTLDTALDARHLTLKDCECVKSEDINDFDFGYHHLCNTLELSDYIIIPNGSIANWLPLISLSPISSVLKYKCLFRRVFLMMNIFRSLNEQEFFHYIAYLRSFHIHPIILGAHIELVVLSKTVLAEYEGEGKQLNSIDHLQAEYFLASLQIISQENHPEYEGIKYDLASVVRAFSIFWGMVT